MRITKGYDVTPRGTSRHTSRENSSASLNTSHYSRENSSLSQNSVEKVYTTRQVDELIKLFPIGSEEINHTHI